VPSLCDSDIEGALTEDLRPRLSLCCRSAAQEVTPELVRYGRDAGAIMRGRDTSTALRTGAIVTLRFAANTRARRPRHMSPPRAAGLQAEDFGGRETFRLCSVQAPTPHEPAGGGGPPRAGTPGATCVIPARAWLSEISRTSAPSRSAPSRWDCGRRRWSGRS
jgi:hypothetical protein